MHDLSALIASTVLPFLLAASDRQGDSAELEAIEVLGRQQNLVREAISASEGAVGPVELGQRPRLRSGDLMEYVPGLVATQHSGAGKANQYFLRGFNLDHGTDFATSVQGMPVNLRSHGHGQGYTDLNFLIPELVEELRYRKGPYRAESGDFASAGSAEFRLARELPHRSFSLGLGEDGFRRLLGIGSMTTGNSGSNFIYGLEQQRYDGPWTDIEENARKTNLAVGFHRDLAGGEANLWMLAYDARWNSPDQVPQRAIEQGRIERLGSLDLSLGGESSRHSLAVSWHGPMADWRLSTSAYAIDYDLQLFSNFTYFLDDPVNGDQFRQFDKRRQYGFEVSGGREFARGQLELGLQLRRDDIDEVGLARTRARRDRSFVRNDEVVEDSAGLYAAWTFDLGQRLRWYLGGRLDRYLFKVRALQLLNSGRTDDDISSLKTSLAWQAAEPIELYLSLGQGFHSNDARGTVIMVDPVNGDPVDAVDPLVRSRGGEFGLRWHVDPKFQATFALWSLELDSELLFVGDAGNTEATDASRRRGAELGLYWFADQRWSAELEVGWTRARLQGRSDDRIPGALPRVIAAGLNAQLGAGWTFGGHLRHFGDYPLIEDGSVRADDATVLNLRLSRAFRECTLSLDVLNAANSKHRDIEYFYASRLPGEPAGGIEDVHFHPLEPRALRLQLDWRF